MGVNYRHQYRPDQLEPFWPNELLKMSVVVLCTLAVIMLFAILPVVLDSIGLHGVLHEEEPADPRGATPLGIKPEWYFLASYQYLRIMPTELLGIGGKGMIAAFVVFTVLFFDFAKAGVNVAFNRAFAEQHAAKGVKRPNKRLVDSIGSID